MANVWTILVLVICGRVHFVSGTIINMALRKTATQSTTIVGFGPEKAVDENTDARYPFGIINTLGSQTTAWWNVDMETIVEHPEVEVYFRTDYTCRRNGLQLYTSTEPFSSYPGGQSCYNVTGSDNGTDINSTISVICSGRWRYFMVYTDVNNDGNGTVLDFGEVRVLVCSNGTYGISCDKSCSSRQCDGTPSSSCDRYTGACPGGCKAGWMGTDCVDECANGTYGTDCVKSCSDRQCRTPSSSCDLETGQCPDGCLDGWRGEDCSNPCPINKYGDKCELDCGHCKSTCDPVNGHCPMGCIEGYEGIRCLNRLPSIGSGNPTQINIIPVVAGTAAGLTVISITVIVIIIWKRRRENLQPTVTVKVTKTSMHVNVEPVQKTTNNDILDLPLHEKTKVTQAVAKSEAVLGNEPEEEIMEEQDKTPSNWDYYNDVVDVIREIRVENLEATVQKNNVKRRRSEINNGNVRNIKLQVGKRGQVITHRRIVQLLGRHLRCGSKLSALMRSFVSDYQLVFHPPMQTHKKTENAGKNKYRGYYPYDYNRVCLSLIPDVPGSDYINASLMHRYNQRKTYIAAQAPNRKTVGDFWRMIWEHRCGRVIMLTGVVEDMRVKCYQYWPDNGKFNTNDFVVEVKGVDARVNYTVRHLKVTSKSSAECRSVVQYHFTSWPDHGVPDTLTFVHFIWMIRQMDTLTDEPLLVHCSAGIGRTGTYIAVDSLLDQARGEGVMDVLGYVSAMRGQRKNMIQTKEQYECVFHCLVEMMKFGDTSMDVEKFTISYSSRGMDCIVDRNTLRELTQMTASELQIDSPKQDRIWVDGNNDFIVRVVPSLTQGTGYLMSVVPPPGLEMLLWKLVEVNNVHNVIVISQLHLPVSDTVDEKGTVTNNNEFTLETTNQGSGTSRSVQLFKLRSSPTMNDLSSYLLRHAHLYHLSAEMSPVVVLHSDSDLNLAVLFCIMGNILSEIIQDRQVNVIGHVRAFKKCFPDITITEHELENLHDFANECVRLTTKIYGNL